MEKIFNFVEKNLVIIILLFLIIYDNCRSNKKNRERFSNSEKIGLCSDGIGGKVHPNVTEEKCMSWIKNKKKYSGYDSNNVFVTIKENIKKQIVHREGTKVNDFYGKKLYKTCKEWIDDPNKKNPSTECLQAIWDDNGCNFTKQGQTDFTKKLNFEKLYLDSQYYYAKGCVGVGVKTEKANEVVEDIEDGLNKSLNVSKNKLNMTGKIEDRVINNIINIRDKSKDKISVGNEKIKEGFSSTKTSEDTKKYLNLDLYLLEIASGYNEAINEGIDKNKAKSILIDDYNSFKNDRTVANIIGEQNIDVFEQELKKVTGVDVKVKEGFSNGYDYDSKGRLREHQMGGGGSYLITALTKANLLSLVQVYQLRKLMLEAFKSVSNRPFFSFYYDNFEPIADMLVKKNRLSEILPNMLKCIDLSKNGQFDLAFEQYIVTGRQAYQICKDLGMDTNDLEDKFNKLDGSINKLPEPNNLFVENGFKQAIKVAN